MDDLTYLLQRRKDSAQRFEALKGGVETLLGDPEYLAKHGNYDLHKLCIYATGSYGRGESSKSSDIDLFMIDTAEAPEESLGNIAQTLIKAGIIRVCEGLDFPEFDGDGKYLEVHKLSEMIDAVGGPNDDARNFFTGRLLLLLESTCLFNKARYDDVLREVIFAYFRDFPSHEDDFLPAYMANDIVRYWKTLCLSYEFKRKLISEGTPEHQAAEKLKNLKLSFSRLMTCFSGLTALAFNHRKGTVTPDEVKALVELTPTERIEFLANSDPDLSHLTEEALSHYQWFLSTLAEDKDSALAWLQDSTNKDEAEERASKYHEAFHDLLLESGSGSKLLQYITV